MSSRKEAPSNLEMLISEEVLPAGTTLDEAVDELTDELNCVECIALEQCADCFGEDTRDKENPRCREVVRAYLNQDYKKKPERCLCSHGGLGLPVCNDNYLAERQGWSGAVLPWNDGTLSVRNHKKETAV